MENDNKYDGWSKDPVIARKYLLELCRLDEQKSYGFYFEDGTGFCGRVDEAIPYLIKRFKVNPDSSFEIDDTISDMEDVDSGELYPPTYEGEVWDPNKKDDRFVDSDDDEDEF